jgi:nitronate monooxygenase
MMGSNAVTKAATEVTYKTVWVAGPTIENTLQYAQLLQSWILTA